jgi:hypothetical protein
LVRVQPGELPIRLGKPESRRAPLEAPFSVPNLVPAVARCPPWRWRTKGPITGPIAHAYAPLGDSHAGVVRQDQLAGHSRPPRGAPPAPSTPPSQPGPPQRPARSLAALQPLLDVRTVVPPVPAKRHAWHRPGARGLAHPRDGRGHSNTNMCSVKIGACFSGGIGIPDRDVLALAPTAPSRRLRGRAEKLEDAHRNEIRLLGLEIPEREAILRALEECPDGPLAELRAVILRDVTWFRAAGARVAFPIRTPRGYSAWRLLASSNTPPLQGLRAY